MKSAETVIDRELDGIQVEIMKMGGLIESMILGTAKALEERDGELAERLRLRDRDVHALESEITLECVRIIGECAPVARDLRTILTIMKINSNLERCGDCAKNIAQRTGILVQSDQIEGAARSIRRMAREVEQLLKDALDALARRDADLAEDVRQRDHDLDQIYNAMFRELIASMMEDPRNITPCIHLNFIAESFARMGDHVAAVAEQVIYLVTGDVADGSRPRADVTSVRTFDGQEP